MTEEEKLNLVREQAAINELGEFCIKLIQEKKASFPIIITALEVTKVLLITAGQAAFLDTQKKPKNKK